MKTKLSVAYLRIVYIASRVVGKIFPKRKTSHATEKVRPAKFFTGEKVPN